LVQFLQSLRHYCCMTVSSSMKPGWYAAWATCLPVLLLFCGVHSNPVDTTPSFVEVGDEAQSSRQQVLVVLYPHVGALDVYGAVEILAQNFDVTYVTRDGSAVHASVLKAAQNLISPNGVLTFEAALEAGQRKPWDLLLVPGGLGSRLLVDDKNFTDSIAGLSKRSNVTSSVCTGAAILANAGVLKYREATTNKYAFDWVVDQTPDKSINWIYNARWTTDFRDNKMVATSSGVSAGMDLAVWLSDYFFGSGAGRKAAIMTEYLPVVRSHDTYATFWCSEEAKELYNHTTSARFCDQLGASKGPSSRVV